MGKKNLTIGEISEILNITPSTLRFWEKENLFHVSKKSNHYRTYTNTDLIDIADILYYRIGGQAVLGRQHVIATPWLTCEPRSCCLPEHGSRGLGSEAKRS